MRPREDDEEIVEDKPHTDDRSAFDEQPAIKVLSPNKEDGQAAEEVEEINAENA